MSEDSSNCTVFIGNLDEKVSDRVLYDILIQAGRVVDLHIPRDKESGRSKGYAFAEYETEEIAEYAIRLFTGLVTLYSRTLRFQISGQDKSSSNVSAGKPNEKFSSRSRQDQGHLNGMETSEHSESIYPGVMFQPSRHRSHFDSNDSNYNYSRRLFGSTMDSINRNRSRR